MPPRSCAPPVPEGQNSTARMPQQGFHSKNSTTGFPQEGAHSKNSTTGFSRCLPDASQMPLTRDFGNNFGGILGQRFGHDLAFGERTRRISGVPLHIILSRIFLDGSGLSMEPWYGHFLLRSWENGGRLENGRKNKKMKVRITKFPIVENVPTPRESIFKLCAASQLPYRAQFKK